MDFNYEVDGVKYKVKKPTEVDIDNAELIQAKEFNKGLKDPNSLFNAEKIELLKKRKIWTTQQDEEMNKSSEKVNELLEKLSEGGYEVDDAVQDAEECIRQRNLYFLYSATLNSLLSDTVENISSKAKMDYLLLRSIYKEDGSQVFQTAEELNDKRDTEIVTKGETIFNEYWYGKLEFPEQQFLEEFAPEKLTDDSPKAERKPFLKNGAPVEQTKE